MERKKTYLPHPERAVKMMEVLETVYLLLTAYVLLDN